MNYETEQHRAFFLLAPQDLVSALHLPPDTQIVSVEWDHQLERIRVFVKHPTLPPWRPGYPQQCVTVLPIERFDDPQPGDFIVTRTAVFA